jgi:phosphoadenosine phosphosulfate reductase
MLPTVELLHEQFVLLSPEDRIRQFYETFGHLKVMVTSSFGTSSLYLLHLLHKVNPEQEIYFINTGYLFQETLAYKEQLQKLFGLKIKDVNPDPHHHAYTTYNKTWEKDPDLCCSVNKVLPFEAVKRQYDWWVAGLVGQQNQFRSSLKIFEKKDGILKFHPLVDVEMAAIQQFIKETGLPQHPLAQWGYGSVGCTHCTKQGEGREGRWAGKAKSECGLHLAS